MSKRLIRSSIYKARTKKVKLLSVVRADGQRRGITMRKILISLYIRKGCSSQEHLAYLQTDRAKSVEKSLARFFVQQTSQFSIHFEISWQLQRERERGGEAPQRQMFIRRIFLMRSGRENERKEMDRNRQERKEKRKLGMLRLRIEMWVWQGVVG